jgi:hypothetical protein
VPGENETCKENIRPVNDTDLGTKALGSRLPTAEKFVANPFKILYITATLS